jgi:hypothetical protein
MGLIQVLREIKEGIVYKRVYKGYIIVARG